MCLIFYDLGNWQSIIFAQQNMLAPLTIHLLIIRILEQLCEVHSLSIQVLYHPKILPFLSGGPRVLSQMWASSQVLTSAACSKRLVLQRCQSRSSSRPSPPPPYLRKVSQNMYYLIVHSVCFRCCYSYNMLHGYIIPYAVICVAYLPLIHFLLLLCSRRCTDEFVSC